jgi:hypothetical protein
MSKKFESNMQRRWLRKGRELQRRKTEFAALAASMDCAYQAVSVSFAKRSPFARG